MIMKIVNRKNIQPINDACGQLQELYHSDNLSMSYAIIARETAPHKHVKLEEVYFIIKGKAELNIDGEIFLITSGDTVSIPKNKYHHFQNVEETVELMVVTHPKFDIKDLIY